MLGEIKNIFQKQIATILFQRRFQQKDSNRNRPSIRALTCCSLWGADVGPAGDRRLVQGHVFCCTVAQPTGVEFFIFVFGLWENFRKNFVFRPASELQALLAQRISITGSATKQEKLSDF